MLNAGVLLLINLDLPIAQRLQSFSKHGGGGNIAYLFGADEGSELTAEESVWSFVLLKSINY